MSDNSKQNVISIIKQANDTVGPGFCIMKWWQVDVRLGEGLTQSCCHVPFQKINLDQDLHNTEQKKQQRKIMLEGGRPAECKRCWDIEDMGNEASPRQILTGMLLEKNRSLKLIEDTAKLNWNEDVYPKHVEVSFSTKCQFKCNYCNPQTSSSIFKEMKDFGEYNISEDNKKHYSITGDVYDEDNVFTKKFWKWLPDAYPHLEVIRITGGEPFLSDDMYKLIDYIESNPSETEFHVNTNLGISKRRLQLYLDRTKNIKTKLYVSIDTWGKQAEYIRNGLDIELFESNLEYMLEAGESIGFMVTFCLMSMPNFDTLLHKVSEYKDKYPNKISFDPCHMTGPKHLTAAIADDDMKSVMKEHYTLMSSLNYNDYELDKFKNCVDWIINTKYDDEDKQRYDFYNFVNQQDNRRNTNFLEVFPEYEDFYNRCGRISG